MTYYAITDGKAVEVKRCAECPRDRVGAGTPHHTEIYVYHHQSACNGTGWIGGEPVFEVGKHPKPIGWFWRKIGGEWMGHHLVASGKAEIGFDTQQQAIDAAVEALAE